MFKDFFEDEEEDEQLPKIEQMKAIINDNNELVVPEQLELDLEY